MASFSRFFNQVMVRFGERSLQFRPEDISVQNLARIFHLIPDTIILISEDGTVNVPNSNGKFEVEDFLEYKVEGDLSTVGTSGTHGSGDQSSAVNRWKPKSFPMKPKTPSVSFTYNVFLKQDADKCQYHIIIQSKFMLLSMPSEVRFPPVRQSCSRSILTSTVEMHGLLTVT